MPIRERDDDLEESEESFERRIEQTPVVPVSRPSRMTEGPLDVDESDEEFKARLFPDKAPKKPSIMDEEPLEEDDDID